MSSILKKLLVICVIFVMVTFSLSAENLYHTVQKGETLYSISKKYHIPVNKLKAVNRIDSSSTIKIGAKLLVPGKQVESTSGKTDRAIGFYRIKKGDTFYSVSKKFKMKLNDLYLLNKMTSADVLSVDKKIKVFGSKLEIENKSVITKEITPLPPKQKQNVVILTKSQKIQKEKINNDKINKKISPLKNKLPVLKGDKSVKLPASGLYKPMSGKLRGAEITVTEEGYFKAIEDGTVIWKGPFREFKNVILVDSGNYVYLFGGMDDIFVNVGQRISRGDRIGGVGQSNNSKIYFSAFKDRMALEYKDIIEIISKRNI